MAKAGLSRRAFLVGTGGICLTLPMLEMTHGNAWAAGATGKTRRFVVVFSHGGSISCRSRKGGKESGTKNHHGLDLWAPESPGSVLVPGQEMAPLTEMANDLILLRGVDNMAGTLQQYGGGHGHANVTTLTCADVVKVDDKERPMGPSIDQVLAERLQLQSPSAFPSIDLTVKGHQYGTPFYRAAKEGVSSEADPKAAFERLFSGVNPSAEPDPALLLLRKRKQSVLDGVLEGFNLFRGKLGSTDKAIVDAHADHIRGIEQQLDALNQIGPACTLPDVSGSPKNLNEADLVTPLMVDLLIHSLRCGLTNVATLQIPDIITKWLPTPANVDLGHSLGHLARDVGPTGPAAHRYDDFVTEIVANRQWRMQMFDRLIRGLKETPEDGTHMLHNSIVLYTSEFSTASVHSVRDLPVLIAGNAGGQWKTGRHINYNKAAQSNPDTLSYDTDASMHNLFTSVLQSFGFEDDHFGNSAAYREGPLAELTA